MKYQLSDDTWSEAEYKAVNEVILSGSFTMGEKVRNFEQMFARKFDVQYAIMSNSGSSANLLAVAALVYSGKLSKGDEVIVPAVSWSTTYYPVCQMGLKLVFVDIDLETLNFDITQLETAITSDTKMILAVNLLGNSNHYQIIKELCKSNNLILMEDNCESMGGEYQGKKLGTIGAIGTFSTFYSHHLCTMEGGMTVTNDEELYHYMLAIRAHGWTRNLPENSRIYSKNQDAFYESFNFIVPGFNLRPLEIEAAAGIEQLKKLDSIIQQRKENAHYFQKRLKEFPQITLQKEVGSSSWFGFAILLQQDEIRDTVVEHLRNADIEVRPIVAGNFVRNRVIQYLEHRVVGVLTNADFIHKHGFFVGNHCKNNYKEIDYFAEHLRNALNG